VFYFGSDFNFVFLKRGNKNNHNFIQLDFLVCNFVTVNAIMIYESFLFLRKVLYIYRGWKTLLGQTGKQMWKYYRCWKRKTINSENNCKKEKELDWIGERKGFVEVLREVMEGRMEAKSR